MTFLHSWAALPPAPSGWRLLPPLPDREGLAGTFAGVAGNSLVVAGGANFPGKKPWEGGAKVWSDLVYVLEKPEGAWRMAGRLPRPLAYGVSLTVKAGVACLGGCDARRHYADCFLLVLENGRLQTRPLPTLPVPLAYHAGAVMDESIYVCGGSDQPGERSALKRLFALDLNAPQPAWRELPPCPGRPRLLAVAAAMNGAFYLAGGVDIVMREGKPVREYLREVWCYRPGKGWQPMPPLPQPAAAAPSPAPVWDSTFFIAGGDDGSLSGFQPISAHPGFPGRLLAYDGRRDQWKEAGTVPAPRATLPAVYWRGHVVFPSGEVRPGIRSPEVWAWTPAQNPNL